MLPGPLFTFELMTTARRGRFYQFRTFYAAILLVILWAIHSAWSKETGGELPYKLVNWFAFSAFCGIAIGQQVIVLTFTPALMAGVIADEKTRKTLHYLLASRLTSAEIIVGKLLARMLYVVVLLGVSLPVLSLLVLLGGIDPLLVLLACGATLSTAWFLASLSIWVSTIARRPREALFIALGLECLWLCFPLMTRTVFTMGWLPVDDAVKWLGEWVRASNPVEVFWRLFWSAMTGGRSRQSEVQLVTWMIGLQAGLGMVLAIMAALQLRPIFRRQSGGAEVRQRHGLRSTLTSWRLRRHPALGKHPMLWKELHTGGARGLTWLIGFLLTLIGGVYLAYYAVWTGGLAFVEWWVHGYFPPIGAFNKQRADFRWFIKFVVPLLYLVGILKVAGMAAGSISSEHEEDTWVSMTATDLTGREIILAKLIGALGRGRQLAEVILLLAAAGVLVSSLHVLSVPVLIVALGVYGWFAAVLGLWISLQLRSTWRAQFLTMASLLLINLTGQGVLNVVTPYGFTPLLWPGFTPHEVGQLAFDPGFVVLLAQAVWPHSWRIRSIDSGLAWQTIFSVLSVLTYATLAALLTWDSLRRFEIVAGRARRSSQRQPAAPARGDITGADTPVEQPSLAGIA
jgi:ABC-type transport system involved in multi-copper enzyme maturation permease subunit